jgi:hypothetical protein
MQIPTNNPSSTTSLLAVEKWIYGLSLLGCAQSSSRESIEALIMPEPIPVPPHV